MCSVDVNCVCIIDVKLCTTSLETELETVLTDLNMKKRKKEINSDPGY